MLTDLSNIPEDLTQETSLNGKYLKGIPTALTNPNVNVGNSDHTHDLDGDHTHIVSIPSHTHGASHSSPVGQRDTVQNTGGASNINHTHSLTCSAEAVADIVADGDHTHDTISNELINRTITFYKKTNTSIGMSRKALPRNTTFFYSKTGVLPSGLLENLNYVDKYFKGDATPGTNSGSTNDHQHDSINHLHSLDVDAHEHIFTFGNASETSTAGNSGEFDNPQDGHGHTPNTAATINKASTPQNSGNDSGHQHDDISHEPSFKTLRLLEINSVSMNRGAPQNGIILWLDTINELPTGWQVSDGTNNTTDMLGKFPKGSATPDTTGGADTHTHSEDTVSHAHSSADVSHDHDPTGASSAADLLTLGLTGGSPFGPISDDHDHSISTVNTQAAQTITVTNAASNHDHGAESNDPESKTIAFIERING